MDQYFDQMIRDRMNDALQDALKGHALGPLPPPPETSRQRLQRQLGGLLIVLGTRLRDGAPLPAHPANWSHG
ncbi:MAG: hypothetical protein A2W36_02135 [Chloroflexi bacterium RBG_16_58_14]|nr:MAG: hypothetical protein A2W36_02135 [Chloroflexi bacterium RBG_16_58_14]